MNIDITKIKNNIIKLRKSARWSQSSLADRCGVTKQAISQIEKGACLPSLKVVSKLSEAFNLSIASLLNEDICHRVDDIFASRFGFIKNLSESDQKLVECIIRRLKNKEQTVNIDITKIKT